MSARMPSAAATTARTRALAVTPLVRASLLAWVVAAALAGLAAASDARAAPPSISAPSAILVEPATGDIVYERDATRSRAIASTTKLMTALLTLERTSLDDVMTTVRYRANPAESLAGFAAGERLTVRDLLRALLMESANDAAATLATRVAGSRAAFVRLMNVRARELGLMSTHYANPIGLDDPHNHSSATDLVKLTLILRRNAFFREVTDTPRTVLASGAHRRAIVNRNALLARVPAVNGVKTGRTDQAGYVLVGSATRDGVTVLSAVLGTTSERRRDADTLALLRYGLSHYRVVSAVRRGDAAGHAGLAHRDGQSVALVPVRTVRRTVRVGERVRVRVLDAPKELDGPLKRGTRVGTVVIVQRGREVGRVPLVTARDVPAATFWERLDDLLPPALLVLLAALVGGSLSLVLLRRRAVRRRERRTGGAPVA